MPFKPVDTAIKVIVGPCIDDTDKKSREEGLVYNESGMEITFDLQLHDGTITTTAVTPTTGGDYDWAHTNQGYYEIEVPASAGASYNNDTEGILTVYGYCDGVLPFRSISYDIISQNAYDTIVKGTDYLNADILAIGGDTDAKDRLMYFYNAIMTGVVAAVTDNGQFTCTASDMSVNADDYNDLYVLFVDGGNRGVARRIQDYIVTTKEIHTTTDFPQTVAVSDRFLVLGAAL